MSNKAKRLAIFRFCAPLASKTFGYDEQLYVCPLCGKEHPEESAKSGELTLEDIPPQSIGGKGLLLTCKNCNSLAGSKLEIFIKNLQDMQEFERIVIGDTTSDATTSGNIIINDEIYRVNIRQLDDITEIKLIENANDPNKINALNKYMRSLSTNDNWDGIEFKIDKTIKFDSRLLKIAYLKSGFLLITAMLGYTYAFDNRLSVVREQISNPEINLLDSSFWTEPREGQFFPRNSIVLVSNPLPLFLVTFDDCAVILPNPSSPPALYEIIKREWGKEQVVSITGETLDWPQKALMLLDIKSNKITNLDNKPS